LGKTIYEFILETNTKNCENGKVLLLFADQINTSVVDYKRSLWTKRVKRLKRKKVANKKHLVRQMRNVKK
jgi:TPP-dependent trihydroxycyclohexane-1,2-dione (THcHDO) dehydratase